MPAKKRPAQPSEPPPWGRLVLDRIGSLEGHMGSLEERLERGIESTKALIEDIRSDNRATIEAVEASREALEQRIERLEQSLGRLDQETLARDAGLERAIRELRLSVQKNSADIGELRLSVLQNSADIRGLQDDVKGLQSDVRGLVAKVASLEERVMALEKHLV